MKLFFFVLSGTVQVCCGLRITERFREDFSMTETATSLHAFKKCHTSFFRERKGYVFACIHEKPKKNPLMDATQAKKTSP
jgi:hypothetical protein